MTTRRHLLSLLILLAGLFNIGCEKDFNVLSKYIAQPGEAAEFGYQFEWQQDLGLRGNQRVIYAEIVSADRLVTLESDNVIQILDTKAGGKILWTAQVAKKTERLSRPQLHGDNLVVCSETKAYIYDMLMGDLINVIKLRYTSNNTPLIIDDYMIHGSSTGRIFSQDLNHGLVRWSTMLDSPITSSPTRAGNSVLVTTQSGQIASFMPRNGTPLWAKKTWDKVTSAPVVGDRFVYLASEDQSLYAFAIASGTSRWRYYGQSPLTKSPIELGGIILQQDNQKGLVSINSNTGEVIWINKKLLDAKLLQAKDGVIMMHRPEQHTIALVTANDGVIAQEITLPHVDHVIPDQRGGGNLYAMRVDGKIMKLSPR